MTTRSKNPNISEKPPFNKYAFCKECGTKDGLLICREGYICVNCFLDERNRPSRIAIDGAKSMDICKIMEKNAKILKENPEDPVDEEYLKRFKIKNNGKEGTV